MITTKFLLWPLSSLRLNWGLAWFQLQVRQMCSVLSIIVRILQSLGVRRSRQQGTDWGCQVGVAEGFRIRTEGRESPHQNDHQGEGTLVSKRQRENIRNIPRGLQAGWWHVSQVVTVMARHHLVSVVSMLGPSPDWIVGVSALEMCLTNCTWLDHKELYLYPWDAGVDDGVSYESPDQPSQPSQPIKVRASRLGKLHNLIFSSMNFSSRRIDDYLFIHLYVTF